MHRKMTERGANYETSFSFYVQNNDCVTCLTIQLDLIFYVIKLLFSLPIIFCYFSKYIIRVKALYYFRKLVYWCLIKIIGHIIFNSIIFVKTRRECLLHTHLRVFQTVIMHLVVIGLDLQGPPSGNTFEYPVTY